MSTLTSVQLTLSGYLKKKYIRSIFESAWLVPLLALCLLMLIYSPRFHDGLYIDDEFHIFGNSFIKNAMNPSLYWYPLQLTTKAWPLTHTVYWILYQLFHEKIFIYRMLLLILHWYNGVLVYSFLLPRARYAALYAALFFWFNPIAIEAVTWISQISTLLSALFLAYWVKNFFASQPSDTKKSVLYLIGVLATKSYGFFLTPLEIIKNKKSIGWTCSLVRSLPALLFSAYSVVIVSWGVHSYAQEEFQGLQYLRGGYHEPAQQPKPIKKQKNIREKASTLANNKNSMVKIENVKTTDRESFEFHVPSYIKQQLNLNRESVFDKISIEGRTFTYYFFRVLYFADLPIHTTSDAVALYIPFLLLGLSSIALLLWCAWHEEWLLALILVSYLPISGLFYVPFMKHSLVADHVFYVPLLLIAIYIGKLYEQLAVNKKLLPLIWLWPVLFFTITVLSIHRMDYVAGPYQGFFQ